MNDFHQQPCCGTLYPDKFSSAPLAYMRWFDEEAFIFVLRQLHQRKVEFKETSWLMSPAIFDPIASRVPLEVLATSSIFRILWLDFEDGDLTPDEFPTLFPHTRMILTNTFRHTVARPRYRAIIPTTQQLTPEERICCFTSRLSESWRMPVTRCPGVSRRPGYAAKRQSGLRLVKTSAH